MYVFGFLNTQNVFQENISSFKNDEENTDTDSKILQNLMEEVGDIGWDRHVYEFPLAH